MLDGILDRLGDAAVIAGLGVWALGGGSDLSAGVVVCLAVAATAGSMLSMASKDRATALGLPPAPERQLGYLLGGRDGRLFLVTVCAILGRPALALAAIAVPGGSLGAWPVDRSARTVGINVMAAVTR